MALNFNASSNAVNLGLDISQTASRGAMSMSAWIFIKSQTVIRQVMSVSIGPPPGTSNLSRMDFQVVTNGALEVSGRSTDADALHVFTGTAGQIALGTWYHVVGTINYTTAFHSIFINGVLANSGAPTGGAYAATTTAATNSKCAAIGSEDDISSKFWDGFMEDVRLYSRLLSDAEVMTMYATAGKDQILDGLLFRYPLFGPESGTALGIVDLTGNRNGTAVASPTFAAGMISPTDRRGLTNLSFAIKL